MRKSLITFLMCFMCIVFAGKTASAIVNASDTVVFDITNAVVTGSDIAIPVSIITDDTVFALDFSFRYDHAHLDYDSITNHTSYIQPLSYYNPGDSTVRFTSFSFSEYDHGVALVSVHLTLLAAQIHHADLYTMIGYLNGDVCSVKLIGGVTSGMEELPASRFHLYPNPVTAGKFFLDVKQQSIVQLIDMKGKELINVYSPDGRLEINTSDFSDGVYLVRAHNDRFVSTQKIVIQQ